LNLWNNWFKFKALGKLPIDLEEFTEDYPEFPGQGWAKQVKV
jgi:hypothetical protein